MLKVQIDLTPWIRGPSTGVGLSAYRCFLALQKYGNGEFIAVSRDHCGIKPFKIKHLNIWKRFWGNKEFIYHSFEGTLPFVDHSRKVLTIQDLWTLRKNPYQDPLFQKRQARKIEASILRASRLITSTKFVKEELVNLYPALRPKVFVVPYAPLFEENKGLEPGKSEAERYLSEKRPYLLCVSTLEVRKNLPFLFRFIKNKPWDFVLVGGLGFGQGKILKEFEALSESGTRCLRFNNLSDNSLAKIYQNCVALVQPSLEEGFGMPVVEAMHFGKPVVLSQIPAHLELAGEAGIYFSLGKDELADQLDKIQNNFEFRKKYETLSKQQSKKFTWQNTATELVRIYEQVK